MIRLQKILLKILEDPFLFVCREAILGWGLAAKGGAGSQKRPRSKNQVLHPDL